MNDWTAGTTYTPSSGFGSLIKRNVATDQFQGLSPAGQKGMGAFGAAMMGAGNQMMGKPMQQIADTSYRDISNLDPNGPPVTLDRNYGPPAPPAPMGAWQRMENGMDNIRDFVGTPTRREPPQGGAFTPARRR